MRTPDYYRHQQKSGAYTALLLFNLCLVIIQLWLFVSVLEEIQVGRTDIAIPGAFASLFCLALNCLLLSALYKAESKS